MNDYFRTMRDLHPTEKLMWDLQVAENGLHEKECEAPAEDEHYEFVSLDGVKYIETICWCGRGMNYKRLVN